MSNEIENAAQVADRYVKAAKAVIHTLEDNQWTAEEREHLQLEIEFALKAAAVYSKCAIAEAIERSFPGLEVPSERLTGLKFTSGGVVLEEDEIDSILREHVDQADRVMRVARGERTFG